jgi:hypothetical protein
MIALYLNSSSRLKLFPHKLGENFSAGSVLDDRPVLEFQSNGFGKYGSLSSAAFTACAMPASVIGIF